MKSTAFLTIIMTINWIFEIISFYNETSSTLFDIINALQGVLIFLMFVCLPQNLKLVGKWWNDRGSFQVLDDFERSPNDIQMTSLCKQWVFRMEREDDLNKRNYAKRKIAKWSSLLVQLRWFVSSGFIFIIHISTTLSSLCILQAFTRPFIPIKFIKWNEMKRRESN